MKFINYLLSLCLLMTSNSCLNRFSAEEEGAHDFGTDANISDVDLDLNFDAGDATDNLLDISVSGDGATPSDFSFVEFGNGNRLPVDATSGQFVGILFHVVSSNLPFGRFRLLVTWPSDYLPSGTYELSAAEHMINMYYIDRVSSVLLHPSGYLRLSGNSPPTGSPTEMLLDFSVFPWISGQIKRIHLSKVLLSPEDWDNRFGIWLLEDENINAIEALGFELGGLRLQSSPIISLSSVYWYHMPSRTLELAATPFFGDKQLPESGLPFVVIANNTRIGIGAFMKDADRSVFPGLVVRESSYLTQSIHFSEAGSTDDILTDSAFLGVMSESGKIVDE